MSTREIPTRQLEIARRDKDEHITGLWKFETRFDIGDFPVVFSPNGNGNMEILDENGATLLRFNDTTGDVAAPNGGLSQNGNAVLDITDQSEVASGVVTLSSGAATIATGVTTTGTNLDVSLDPSGNGNNAADVKASARVFWDNAAGEYKVEILEDGTSVGNPDIGYTVVQN